MNQNVPTVSAPWRLLLFRNSFPELLLFETAAGLCLPVVEIFLHERIAERINAQVKALWDIDVVSLFPLPVKEGDRCMWFHVVETLHHDESAPPAGRWISVSQVSRDSFAHEAEFAAVEKYVEHTTAGIPDAQPAPFEVRGWFHAAEELARQSAEEPAHLLAGRFLQLNASSTFSLVRFETTGPAVWFKAVGEPNLREFALTLLLSTRLSGFVPQVLKTRPEWHAWTMREATGVPLSHAANCSAWYQAAQDFARLQIASIKMTGELLTCGARDVRTQALLREAEAFFKVIRGLMESQSAAAPPPLSAEELRILESDIRERLLDLRDSDIPDTLGHLDLNPDNIIVNSDSALFLDWAEACVGHPFLSFCYLLEFFSQRFPGNDNAESLLVRSYAEIWQASALGRDLEPALPGCALLAIFAHAVATDAWRDQQGVRDPRLAGYYRSLARRMKRYGDRIRRGVREITDVVA